MAAIRRSFSGALQRRRSASMTPEQKTEETKLERLTERFERGMRNLKTLETRLITVSGAARNFRLINAGLNSKPAAGSNGSRQLDVAIASSGSGYLRRGVPSYHTHRYDAALPDLLVSYRR